MRLPTLSIRLKKDKIYADGSHPIMISIHFRAEKRRIQFKEAVHPDQFDQETRRLKKSAPDAKRINQRLDEYQASFNAFVKALVASAERDRRTEVETTAKEIELYLLEEHQEEKVKARKKDPTAKMSFFEFADLEVERLRTNKKHGLQFRYATASRKFRDFLQGKDIALPDLTTKMINDYYRHLVDELKNRDNTAHVSVRILKTIYRRAMDRFPELGDPFKKTEIRPRGSSRAIERLITSDIKAITALKLPAGSTIDRSRDMFIFAFYCLGSRVGDMILLKWSSINARRTMVTLTMAKTGSEVKAKVMPQMKAILEKYRGKGETYVFGAIPEDLTDSQVLAMRIKSTTALINRDLKRIGDLAEVSIGGKNMHSHIARHSLAGMVYERTKDLRLVKAICRHSDIRITELYVGKLDQEDLHERMEDFWETVKLEGV